MDEAYQQLNKQLQHLIKEMQKIQKGLAASHQPASLHELDKLKQLGLAYSSTVEQIASLSPEKTVKVAS